MAKTLQDYMGKYEDYDKVYKNKEVFDPNWAPEKLEMIRHRDDQTDKYVKALMDFIHHDIRVSRFLVGPNSTGKSLLVKYWKNALPQVLKNGEKEIEYVIIPCGSTNSWRDVGATLSNKLNLGVNTKNSPLQLFSDIFEEMSKEKKYILVFDEIDKLSKHTRSKIITIISRPSEVIEEYPRFLTIIAGNDISTIEELDWDRKDRTHTSSFNPNIIGFPAYDFNDIKDIMEARFEQGLNEDLYDEKVVRHLSKKIKQNLNSDIRLGLKAIELAISEFQSSNSSKLKGEHIEEGIYKATETSIRSKFNIIGNKHAILLARILAKLGNDTKVSNLIEEYRKRVDESYDEFTERAKSSIYRYMGKLGNYKIIKKHKSGSGNENEYSFKRPYTPKLIKKTIDEGDYFEKPIY